MEIARERIVRKRTVQDKIISFINEVRFNIFEPYLLMQARRKYEENYRRPDEQPLVSVYTPTYNRAHVLMERAVPSVLLQSYKNFEYIIIGDCCTDETEKFVKGIKDSRIRFYNLPNRKRRYPDDGDNVINHWLAGPVVAANTALQMVKGKWIARLDDWVNWTPNHIEDLLLYAQNNNYEFVTGATEDHLGRKSVGEYAIGPYFKIYNPPKRNNVNVIIGPTQTFFYRSYLNCFKYNINCWRKSWNKNNDNDLLVRFFKAGVRMGYLDKIVARTIPRPGETHFNYEAFMHRLEEKKKHFAFKQK